MGKARRLAPIGRVEPVVDICTFGYTRRLLPVHELTEPFLAFARKPSVASTGRISDFVHMRKRSERGER